MYLSLGQQMFIFKNLCSNIYYYYLYKISLYQNNVAALFGIGHILDSASSINGHSMKKFNNKKLF